MTSLLDDLRGLSTVDCDTLDVDVAATLGPFADCTSNQAIAFAELSKLGPDGRPVYQQLMVESIQIAHWMFAKQSEATLEELAVELMMVALSLQFAPHINGCLHVQVNPKWSYSTHKLVKNAERIIAHFKHISPEFDISRVCIKIPATWEGLQACRELSARRITVLATTVFCMEQVALAVDAGCRYIAPYVNELRVHFDTSYVDTNKAFLLCGAAQHYCDTQAAAAAQQAQLQPGWPVPRGTKVVAASLTSIDEVMRLAGLHHITISPPLLAQLAATPALEWTPAVGAVGDVLVQTRGGSSSSELDKFAAQHPQALREESLWRMALTRSQGGAGETKLVQAINIFADMQDSLEELARKMDPTRAAALV